MHKPFSIRLLSILFILAPAAVLLFNAVTNLVPLYGPGNIWMRLSLFDRIILLIYPITAVAIYTVRPWGWWTILVAALTLVVYNVVVYLQSSFATLLLMLGMNLLLFAVAALFFRKHIIAPYFNPQLRWWEQERRYDGRTFVKLLNDNTTMLIDNISESGCFLISPVKLSHQKNLFLEIVSGQFIIHLIADVVRSEYRGENLHGYGMMFTGMRPEDERGLMELLSGLSEIQPDYQEEKPDEANGSGRRDRRYVMGYHGNLQNAEVGEEGFPAGLVDVSRSGCALNSTTCFEPGQSVRLRLNMHGKEIAIPASVIWARPGKTLCRYGLRFDAPGRETRAAIRKIIRETRRTGGRVEARDHSAWELQCELAIQNTPLKSLIRQRKHYIM